VKRAGMVSRGLASTLVSRKPGELRQEGLMDKPDRFRRLLIN